MSNELSKSFFKGTFWRAMSYEVFEDSFGFRFRVCFCCLGWGCGVAACGFMILSRSPHPKP